MGITCLSQNSDALNLRLKILSMLRTPLSCSRSDSLCMAWCVPNTRSFRQHASSAKDARFGILGLFRKLLANVKSIFRSIMLESSENA